MAYHSSFTGQHIDQYDDRITDLQQRITALETQPHIISSGGNISTQQGYWQIWSNSVKEWWATIEYDNLNKYYTQPGTSYAGYSLGIYFPSGLFTKTPKIFYSVSCGSGFALTGTLLTPSPNSSTASNYFTAYWLSTASPPASGFVNVYCVGT